MLNGRGKRGEEEEEEECYSFESSFDRSVAALTAAITAARNPDFSAASTPAMVVPPGEHT